MVTCSSCPEEYEKYEGNFYKNSRNKFGFKAACIKCDKIKVAHVKKDKLIKYNRLMKARATKARWYQNRKYMISDDKANSILIKVEEYSKNLRWQEDKIILADIKLCEW